DFRMVDPEHVLVAVPRLLTRALLRMGRHLPDPLRRRTFDDYVRALAAIAPLPRGIHAASDAGCRRHRRTGPLMTTPSTTPHRAAAAASASPGTRRGVVLD